MELVEEQFGAAIEKTDQLGTVTFPSFPNLNITLTYVPPGSCVNGSTPKEVEVGTNDIRALPEQCHSSFDDREAPGIVAMKAERQAWVPPQQISNFTACTFNQGKKNFSLQDRINDNCRSGCEHPNSRGATFQLPRWM